MTTPLDQTLDFKIRFGDIGSHNSAFVF